MSLNSEIIIIIIRQLEYFPLEAETAAPDTQTDFMIDIGAAQYKPI